MHLNIESIKTIIIKTNIIANKLQCPIYLVGSILFKKNYRDIDIRAIMPKIQFENLFGKIEQYNNEENTGKWTKGCKLKWSIICINIWKEFFNSNPIIDFQINYENQYKEQKILISKKININ